MLEDHADVAARRRQRVEPLAVHQDAPRVRRLEAGEEAEEGGLAAAGGAEEGQHLAAPDGEGDAVEHRVAAEALAQPVEDEERRRRHPRPRTVRSQVAIHSWERASMSFQSTGAGTSCAETSRAQAGAARAGCRCAPAGGRPRAPRGAAPPRSPPTR